MQHAVSNLDLRLIRVFISVLDAGGVSAAQASLNIGQSTISQQLATLETRLGYRLCERGRSGFCLTSRGERFAQLARELLQHLDRVSQQARQIGAELSGELHLGLIDHTPAGQHTVLSRAMARFSERSPALHICMSVHSPGELEDKLLSGQIDLALGYFWRQLPALNYLHLFDEQQLAYCASAHPLYQKAGQISVEEALQHRWVWRSYPVAESGFTPPPSGISALADNMEATAMFILSGSLLGCLPDHFASAYVSQGQLKPLNPQRLAYHVPFCLVSRQADRQAELVQAFQSDLQSVL